MSYLYLCCLLPVFAGMVAYLISHKVNLLEWAAGSAACFVVAGIVHYASFASQTSDHEVWSGRIINAKQFSAWQEYYEEAVYKTERYTDSKGKSQSRQVFSHWDPETRWHQEHFRCYSDIDTSYEISRYQFEQWCKQWGGGVTTVEGDRTTLEHASRMIAGDPNDYVAYCPLSITEPVHDRHSVVNRIIASKSVFSFIQLSEAQKKLVFSYPEITDPFTSNRVLGVARGTVSTKDWDSMLARLGPSKKLNMILAGFDSDDQSLAELQRSFWSGGKKNDLVLCYGPGWSKVFGWSDSDVLKRDLESILLEGNISSATLPRIEQAVQDGYQKTNWHKFDHLSIEPTGAAWGWFWFFMLATQGGLYFYFHVNEHDKFGVDWSKGGRARMPEPAPPPNQSRGGRVRPTNIRRAPTPHQCRMQDEYGRRSLWGRVSDTVTEFGSSIASGIGSAVSSIDFSSSDSDSSGGGGGDD